MDEERIKALEATVARQAAEIDSLKRQIVMFIGFVDRTSKFMVAVSAVLEKQEADKPKTPKLEVVQ
jgi:uncharacterized coiled-coil protein SlyX